MNKWTIPGQSISGTVNLNSSNSGCSRFSLKEAKSATMNIFRKKKHFLFKSFVKVEISYVFTINLFTIAETARKSEFSYKIGVCFLLLVIIYVPQIIIDS